MVYMEEVSCPPVLEKLFVLLLRILAVNTSKYVRFYRLKFTEICFTSPVMGLEWRDVREFIGMIRAIFNAVT